MPDPTHRTPASSYFKDDPYISLPGHTLNGYFAFRLCHGASGGIKMDILEEWPAGFGAAHAEGVITDLREARMLAVGDGVIWLVDSSEVRIGTEKLRGVNPAGATGPTHGERPIPILQIRQAPSSKGP